METSMPRARDGTAGFTLIEVLVAFAVVAVLLVPILHGFAMGTAGASRTQSLAEATIVAESALEAIGPALALTNGAVDDRQEGPYRVMSMVRRFHDESAAARDSVVVPYEIIVAVSWRDAGKPRSISLRTLRLGPPAGSEPAP
jgi:general secretion pathway protein I